LAAAFHIVVALEGQPRLDDNPALHQAVALARRQPRAQLTVLAARREGQRLQGPHRRRLEAQALTSLAQRLAAAGIPLLHRPQLTTAAALAELAAIRPADAVLHAEESRLFGDWPLPPAAFPRVFSDFRRQLRQAPEPPLPPPDLEGLSSDPGAWPRDWLHPGADGAPASHQDPHREPRADPRSAFPFRGDEPAALARLQHYVVGSDGLRDYKTTRNGLVGTAFSSKVSPFLAVGSLSVRRIWEAVERFEAEHGGGEGPEWMKQELLWREFFLWSEQQQPERFHALEGVQGRPFSGEADRERFARWARADSGDPRIDALLQELHATGYLSNRGRQWVASHFVNSLRLPWTWGARHFEWMLADAHPALNSGNWAYLAGVGADPRSFGRGGGPRRFDLDRQGRLYDPEGAHARRWA